MDAAPGTAMFYRMLRVAFGVLGIVALAWIPLRNLHEAAFSTGNYFSFFTIQSNVLGVAVLLFGGLRDPQSPRWQVLRGATALYLLITGVVYAVLLANIDVMLTDRWINDILHRVMPIVLVADWVLVPASTRVTLSPRLIALWLIYPVIYGTYTLIRGPMVDWYPYPFLDPRHQGYISLAIGLIILTAVFTLLAIAIAAVGGRARPRPS